MPLPHDQRLILASTSPRRQQLLGSLGLQFEVHAPDFEERQQPGELAAAYAQRNAYGKAMAVVRQLFAPHSNTPRGTAERCLVVAADTIVVLGESEVLEKPSDFEDACRMLRRLSGATHTVFSGLSILQVANTDGRILAQRSGVVRSQVQFKTLTDEEIRTYVATGEPMDKAGSYAMQGKSSYMVARIIGSHTNVIGLPLTETYEWLESFV